MESSDVRLARVEEGLVSVKGDTSYMRKSLDKLTENHWKLSGKVVGIASTLSIITSLLTSVAVKFFGH